jgi:hypothetical protein
VCRRGTVGVSGRSRRRVCCHHLGYGRQTNPASLWVFLEGERLGSLPQSVEICRVIDATTTTTTATGNVVAVTAIASLTAAGAGRDAGSGSRSDFKCGNISSYVSRSR